MKSEIKINRGRRSVWRLISVLPKFLRLKSKPKIGEDIIYLKIVWKVGGGFVTPTDILICVDKFNKRMRLKHGWMRYSKENLQKIVTHFEKLTQKKGGEK